jgi:hypothetical protein
VTSTVSVMPSVSLYETVTRPCMNAALASSEGFMTFVFCSPKEYTGFRRPIHEHGAAWPQSWRSRFLDLAAGIKRSRLSALRKWIWLEAGVRVALAIVEDGRW